MLSKKILLIFVCGVFLVFGMTGVSGAAADYVWGSGPANWSDADKTVGDSLMCWAAVASNTLSYTGWYGTTDGIDTVSSADNIFNYVKDYWPNDTSNAWHGWEWWFDGTETDSSTTPSGGGGFYAGLMNANGYWGTWLNEGGTDTIEKLAGFVSDGRGISIDIDAGVGHALTVWGIDTTAQELYITDSDDATNALLTFAYYSSGSYYKIDDYVNGTWQTTPVDTQITGIAGLWGNSGGIQPYYENGTPVPEPATMLLLGTGLLGLACFSRKRIRA